MRNHHKNIHVETVSNVRKNLQYLDMGMFVYILSGRMSMSEELRRGIPKAVLTGERTIFTEEEKRKNDERFEKILKNAGVLKENESIKELKHIE